MFNRDDQSGDDPATTPRGGALSQSLGLQLSPMTPRFAQQLGVSADAGGLVILNVDAGSDAGQKGIQPGDIVVSANYKAVDEVGQLESIVSEAKSAGRTTVLLRIQRRGRPLTYVPIRLR
jgi:serine protease Do